MARSAPNKRSSNQPRQALFPRAVLSREMRFLLRRRYFCAETLRNGKMTTGDRPCWNRADDEHAKALFFTPSLARLEITGSRNDRRDRRKLWKTFLTFYFAVPPPPPPPRPPRVFSTREKSSTTVTGGARFVCSRPIPPPPPPLDPPISNRRVRAACRERRASDFN